MGTPLQGCGLVCTLATCEVPFVFQGSTVCADLQHAGNVPDTLVDGREHSGKDTADRICDALPEEGKSSLSKAAVSACR